MTADERPEVIAQRNFRANRDRLAAMDLAERFRYIHDKNLWGSDASVSGTGSTIDATAILRTGIPVLLRETGARSVLDIPCGDFGWLNTVELGVPYLGADIVPALVEANRARYGRPDRTFVCADLTRGSLPQADLVLCRDCLVHLSFANVERALANIRASGAKWLLTTHFTQLEENADIEDGDWRPLNFERPPFSFAPPERVLVEGCQEYGGAYDDKTLALWHVA